MNQRDSADEIARLRAAVETLSELVIAHGVMDARTLESIVGDLVPPSMLPAALRTPLPPPAPSAAQTILQRGVPRPTAVAARPAPAMAATPEPVVVPVAPTVAPVVASPFPAAPNEPPAKRNPFDAVDAARVTAELNEAPPPPLPAHGFFARLLGRAKASPAAVAKKAASVEFTERMPKLPDDGLYSEQQRATELSFPPPPPRGFRKPAAPRAARASEAAPARFCDRCWRRLSASGTCTTCRAST